MNVKCESRAKQNITHLMYNCIAIILLAIWQFSIIRCLNSHYYLHKLIKPSVPVTSLLPCCTLGTHCRRDHSLQCSVLVTIASVMSAVACRHRSCQLKINAVRDSSSHRSCFFGPQPVDTNNHPRTHTLHYLVTCRD